ncbi:unnamed protein product [Leptosia nina]|uniref:Uncharacterized protein n=1 Tax=Leptosia nina TaxID=320188 RepID=A0AAV1J055_9NEOP
MSIPSKKQKCITSDLDNTAPVKQILDELPHKNGEAFKFYAKNLLQKPLLPKHWLRPSYPLNTFDEDWDGQLLHNYFEPLGFKSLPPKIINSIRNVDRKDPVTDYISNKLEWKKQLSDCKIAFANNKCEEDVEILNEDVISCPKLVVTTAELLKKDPEPYFDDTYNWYYAGFGNLQLLSLEGKDYILYSEFSKLYLKEFDKKHIKVTSDACASFDCSQEHNILEIVYTIMQIPVIALRTRNKLFILKLLADRTFEKISSLDSDIPYVGISFDGYHKKVLNVTRLDGVLFLINIETLLAKKILLKSHKNKKLNNWNVVLSAKNNYYLNVTRNSVCVYDKRTNDIEHYYKLIKTIVDEPHCNKISVARQFEGTDHLYFGTSHHLFVLDLRFVKKYQLDVIQRWTHGMEFPPIYMDKCNIQSNRDMLCLSSQWCEDICVVADYKKSEFLTQSSNVSMPYRPPSILSVLQEAREQLLCDDFYNPLDCRLNSSICGNKLLNLNDTCDILTLNSLGDITHHMLYPDHMQGIVEDDSVQSLYEWSKSYKIETKPFHVTTIFNIADAWKKLRKVSHDEMLSQYDSTTSKFDENEIWQVFENEEVDIELKEVWMEANNATEETSIASDL